jgi:hypothetical protein
MSESTQLPDSFTTTVPVLLSHPHLFQAVKFKDPRTGKESGEPKFSANFVFEADSADLKALKAQAAAVAKAKWPGRDLKTLVFPFKDGSKLADARKTACEKKGREPDGEFQRGKVILVTRSKYPPRLSFVENGRIIDVDDPLDTNDPQVVKAKNKLFFGALVLAQFRFVTHEVGSNTPGVNCYPQMICATGKGERLASRASGSETFKGYVGQVSAEDPTGYPDDDIPF